MALSHLGTGRLCAQIQSADLSGRITTTDGIPIPAARITAVNVATDDQVTGFSNNSGIYLLTGLAPGEYRLTVEKYGFKVSTRSNVQLHIQSQLSENFHLQIGYSNETVSSRSSSWSAETSPASRSVLGKNFPENIPLNGRSFEPLFWMVPGYVSAATYYTSPGQSSFNGRRTTENYITVDGASILLGTSQGTDVTLGEGAGESLPALTALGSTNGLISPDEIQEFTVQSNAYSPRFGHLPGAQVSILTRSGSNTLHGTAFEYFRNQHLDATDWFAGYNHLPKAGETQNDFGFNLSGPLWKNRFFGFAIYEGLRLVQPQSRTEVVPSMAARMAAPSAVRMVLESFPLPNRGPQSAALGLFAATPKDSATLNSTSFRLDFTLSPRASMFARASYSPSQATQRGAFDYYSMSTLGHTRANLNSLTWGGTLRFAQSAVYETRANLSNYSSGTWVSQDSFGGGTPLPLSSQFSSYPTAARENSNFTALFRSDNNGIYLGRDIDNRQQQWELTQEMQFPLRNHAFAAGVDLRFLAPVNGFRAYTAWYTFAGFEEAISATTSSTSVQASTSGQVHLLFQNISAYIQDTWRPTPSWNVTYGLRWEGDKPPHDRNNLSLYTAVGLEQPATLQLAPAGTPLWHTEWSNLAPRLGIGYQLSKHPGWEAQLRGNIGLFYGLASSAASRVALGAPYFVSRALGPTNFPLREEQATPPESTLTIPYNLLYAFPRNFQSPRIAEWNLGIEQRLGAHWMTTTEYVGSTGDRLLHREVLLPSEGLNTAFTSVELVNNKAHSNYQALQFRLVRSFGDGVMLWANYNFSHSLDTASSLAHPSPFYLTYDPERDYGRSDFDVRHSMAIVMTYTTHGFTSSSWLRNGLSEWSIASSFRGRTGMPINILTGSDLIDLGYTKSNYRRPNRIPNQAFWLHKSEYPGGRILNRGAFQPDTAILQGNLARNAVNGFGVWQEDISISRMFPLHDNPHLGLRIDIFNLLNHPSFGDPGTQYTTSNLLSSASFGTSSASLAQSLGHGGADGGYNPVYQIGGQRSIQLSLKVTF